MALSHCDDTEQGHGGEKDGHDELLARHVPLISAVSLHLRDIEQSRQAAIQLQAHTENLSEIECSKSAIIAGLQRRNNHTAIK
jgi:hypothetical protein